MLNLILDRSCGMKKIMNHSDQQPDIQCIIGYFNREILRCTPLTPLIMTSDSLLHNVYVNHKLPVLLSFPRTFRCGIAD